MAYYNLQSTKKDVLTDPCFKDFGYLFFPVDRNVPDYYTLERITSSEVYIWYSNLHPDTTVKILNTFHEASKQYQIYYSFYTKEEINKDPSKKDTGLFFLKGKREAPYALCNAGGGFMYVGSMHDSFPHALKINEYGYNAFVLIYRPDHAYEDLARAIYFIETNSELLEVAKENYSLWGGSAGARMAARLGNLRYLRKYLPESIPQASAVIMQYTGYEEVSKYDGPTFVTVGTNDYIANYQDMKYRLERLSKLGIPTSFHAYRGLSHGFGIGEGTNAEGWINEAIEFWEKNMKM